MGTVRPNTSARYNPSVMAQFGEGMISEAAATTLKIYYRMPEPICMLLKPTYGIDMSSHPSARHAYRNATSRYLDIPTVLFIDVERAETTDDQYQKRVVLQECRAARDLVNDLLLKGLKAEDIVVLGLTIEGYVRCTLLSSDC